MLLALLLTALATAGVAVGVTLGQSRRVSTNLGAAGGGLLVGMAVFGLIPEAAQSLGWGWALGVAALVCAVLILLDRWLLHGNGHVERNVVGSVLVLTAIHGFLDGWSVRAAAVGPMASVTVTLGLALHKLPEGLALGWILRRRESRPGLAFLAGGGAELMTLVGAVAEPRIQLAGEERFGLGWTVLVLCLIAGSFCFLGAHAVWPARRQWSAVLLFGVMLVAVFVAARFR